MDLHALQTLKLTSASPDEEAFNEAVQMMSSLLKRNQEGKVFLKSDLYFYRGVYLFYLKQYEQASMNMRKSYDLKEESQN